MKKKMTYQEALQELEKKVELIEDPERGLEMLGNDIKEAMELVKFCKNSLHSTEEELNKIIGGQD